MKPHEVPLWRYPSSDYYSASPRDGYRLPGESANQWEKGQPCKHQDVTRDLHIALFNSMHDADLYTTGFDHAIPGDDVWQFVNQLPGGAIAVVTTWTDSDDIGCKYDDFQRSTP